MHSILHPLLHDLYWVRWCFINKIAHVKTALNFIHIMKAICHFIYCRINVICLNFSFFVRMKRIHKNYGVKHILFAMCCKTFKSHKPYTHMNLLFCCATLRIIYMIWNDISQSNIELGKLKNMINCRYEEFAFNLINGCEGYPWQ